MAKPHPVRHIKISSHIPSQSVYCSSYTTDLKWHNSLLTASATLQYEWSKHNPEKFQLSLCPCEMEDVYESKFPWMYYSTYLVSISYAILFGLRWNLQRRTFKAESSREVCEVEVGQDAQISLHQKDAVYSACMSVCVLGLLKDIFFDPKPQW